ncbi:hypothetical protein ACIRPH_31360 [Nocardiopsis sp. NPDC101807]|uniref:hypothetical protein n=1 Tax=Nocardiopsis sp. NPDC101807 TaxID=3364339 RepID=UPI00381BA3C1
MTVHIRTGQIYRSNRRADDTIRVIRPDWGYALGPSALVENLDGSNVRWVRLRKLHTDGKRHWTGYSLVEETA